MKLGLSSIVIVFLLTSLSSSLLPIKEVISGQDNSRILRAESVSAGEGRKPTSTNTSAAAEPGSNAETGASPSPTPPLRRFEFETVTVDSKGGVTNRRKGQAQYFTEDIKGVSLEMVEIPGGTFRMGSPAGVAPNASNESPHHTVSVPAFYMGKYEVTQAQWRTVASFPKVKRDLNPTPSYFKGDNLPVEQVSWEEVVEFCERLSRATGRPYRLPSEAEWEYACRAGSTSQFTFGDMITLELVNYDGHYIYGASPTGTERHRTTPVGELGIANAFGLFDMHGNVAEWCLDPWHENYNGAPSDGKVWEGGDASGRVTRGGSWIDSGTFIRSAYRLMHFPDTKLKSLGFRLALAGK